MLEDVVIDGFQATGCDVRTAMEWVDELYGLYGVIVGEVAHDLCERGRDGVDGEVALTQVIFQATAFERRNIKDEFCAFIC